MASSHDERMRKALEEAENQLRLITELEDTFEKSSIDHTRQYFVDELEKLDQLTTSQAERVRLSGAEVLVCLMHGAAGIYNVETVRWSPISPEVDRITLAELRAKGSLYIPYETFKDILSKLKASIPSGEQDGNLHLGIRRLLYDRAFEVTADRALTPASSAPKKRSSTQRIVPLTPELDRMYEDLLKKKQDRATGQKK
ncbi:hypothetical protein MUO56_02840 [Candidatus Bathyarchaeota archaeon]|nr:hypothetical protein [Candidatus Bathyarchaeota archaeon]